MPVCSPCQQSCTSLIQDITICQKSICSNHNSMALWQKNICLCIGNQGDSDTMLDQLLSHISSLIARTPFQYYNLLNLRVTGSKHTHNGARQTMRHERSCKQGTSKLYNMFYGSIVFMQEMGSRLCHISETTIY